MSIDPLLRRKLLKGDPQPLEEAWLVALEDRELDHEFFHQAARALIGAGRGDSVKSLLELLDEALVERGDLAGRLELLRSFGDKMLSPAKLHGEIVRVLRSRHGNHSMFAELEEWVGLQRAKDDLQKTWEKVDRLESVIGFDVGAIVLLTGKGPGRIVEINLTLKNFRVEVVPSKTAITVGFAGAKKLLTLLPDGHFQRRKVEDPDTLATLRETNPSELLRLVLVGADGPLTAQEIRDAVSGLVSTTQWTSWWNAARKHPQLVALPGGRHQYTWAANADDAASTIRRRFERAGLKERLDLLRGQENGPLRDLLVAELRVQAEALAAKQPARAFEIAVALGRTGAVPGANWTVKALLERPDAMAILAEIDDRGAREVAVQTLPEVLGGTELAAQRVLVEEDPKLVDQLLAQLSVQQIAVLENQALLQPHRSPGLFVRLAERAAEDEALRRRYPAKLLQQILASLGNDRFGPMRKRLEALVEPGSTVPRLVPLLEEDQAKAAEESVQRAHGLADFQREPLLNALQLRFASLRKQTEVPLYATDEAILAKKRELKELLEIEIPTNRKAIQEARELGDLRENFEYKSARQRHEYLSARVQQLDSDLRRAQPIRFDPNPTAVRVGTIVEVGGTTYSILGPWDSDPEAGVLSNESELASKLLGHEVGDTVPGIGEITAIRTFR